MRHCLKSNDQLTLEMQHTYEEQKSSMDEMIKQVALLADIMREIQEDRADTRVNEKRIKEEKVSVTEEKEPPDAEQKSEESLEKQRDAVATKARTAEEELSVTPLMDDLTCKTPEEVKDKLPWEKEEDIIRCKEPDASLFYLQAKIEHILKGGTEKFVPKEGGRETTSSDR